MKKLNVMSLFDGISCGHISFDKAGILVDKYYASEIDKYAIQVTMKNYPNTIQLGDVRNIDFTQFIGKIDILIGGSPCQDLSIAKNDRKGLAGERSGLFFKYVEALQTIKPKYFLLENVASMSKENRDKITEILGVEPIMINSALVSAQQRKRLYWTNIPGVEQPQDKGILLKDILESGLAEDEKSCTIKAQYQRNSYANFFAKNGRRAIGIFEPMRITEATKKGYAEIQQGDCVDLTQPNSKTRRGRSMKDKSNCLMAGTPQYYQYIGKEPIRIGNLAGKGTGQANRIYSVEGKSVCLNANGGGGGAKTGLYKIDLPDGEYIVRKLTPLECERLQTLPEGYTEGISNAQRYKCIGNGWTVDVIAHILKGLKNEQI